MSRENIDLAKRDTVATLLAGVVVAATARAQTSTPAVFDLFAEATANEQGRTILSAEENKLFAALSDSSKSQKRYTEQLQSLKLQPNDVQMHVAARMIYRALHQDYPGLVGTIFAVLPAAKDIKFKRNPKEDPITWDQLAREGFVFGNKTKYELPQGGSTMVRIINGHTGGAQKRLGISTAAATR